MAFLGTNELKGLLSSKPIITDGSNNNIYSEQRIEEASYALSLGNEAYRTDNKDRKIEILDEKSKTIEINPGQFTLLLTKEYVRIPKDKLAFISIKAKQKLKGLVNVSGFHVDPGFEGKLLFSVYNAGPSTITLETEKPYFLIWFASLESELSNDDAYNVTKNNHQGQKSIPLDYVDALKRGEIASPSELLNKIKDNKILLERLIWIGGIILGIAITTTIKTIYDWNQFKEGYNFGIKEKKVEEEISYKLNLYFNDSLHLQRIDSLINSRLEEKNVKTK